MNRSKERGEGAGSPRGAGGATAPDGLLERIRGLERRALGLEPDAGERAALSRAAVAYAEELLSSPESGRAYLGDTGSAEALAEASIGRYPIGLDRALSLLGRHVDRTGQNTSAPGFFAFIPGGNLYHAALGDFLAAVSNRFSAHPLGCPGAVRLDNQVLRWLASIVGYPAEAAGNLTSGGSLANLSAIITAREAMGIRGRDVDRAAVYLTAHAHHCITKGLRLAGLGECVLRRVPVDSRFRMDADALEDAMAADARSGLKPWLVVATAGTTDTGAVDPLEEVAAVASRHGAWFHTDAAYGGMFRLCSDGRALLRGLERSDSIVLDPHKGLFLPFGLGAVLVREAAAMRAAFTFDASYIPERGRGGDVVSPAEYSLELTRPFRALRLWLPLQVLGTGPFEAALEEKLLLARYAHQRFREMPGIEVGPEPDLSLFVFRAVPRDGDPDAFTARLEQSLREDGRVGLSPTVLNGSRFLRFAVLSVRTHRESVDRALEVIGEHREALGDR